MKTMFGSTAALLLSASMLTGIGAVGGVMGVFVPSAVAQTAAADTSLVTEDDIINGTMEIDFGTRSNLDNTGKLKEGSAAVGAKDKYKFKLDVAKTVNFSGEITRQPNLYSKTIAAKKQEAQLGFSIDLAVMNPKDIKQKRVVGKWVGTVPVNPTTGAFDLAGGAAKDSPLRMQVDTVGKAQGFEEKFGGILVGKAEKKEALASYTFKRLIGNKEVSFVVKKSDPMRFENVILAKGPAEVYARTSVSGRLDYDYETGNWITDGIKFRYTLDGKEVEDIVTGTIKWVEDSDRKSNGKGAYEFNLRFNESKNKPAGNEASAFDKMAAEDAFFAVDSSIPCLTGKVTYVDTFSGGGETPVSSKVEYHLNANKLTKQQVVNFAKLWLLGTGPINDE